MNYFEHMLIEMNKLLRWQNDKLGDIERQLQQLTDQIANLKPTSITHVDRIEYRFDQLKVDELHGNLAIGMPSASAGAGDQAAGSLQTQQDNGAQLSLPEAVPVRDMMRAYIVNEVPELLKTTANRLNTSLTDEQTKAALDDIEQQIHTRIELYEHHFKGGMNEGGTRERMVSRLKNDIVLSLDKYVQYFGGDGDEPASAIGGNER